ncbi:MAG: hypothetical protein WDN06_22990 [Asticcacaulis sp.]
MAPAAVSLANVLLVDDREADVELTRVFLKVRDKMEFNLSVARGGQEALDMLEPRQRRRQSHPTWSCSISTCRAWTAFETLERLRAHAALERHGGGDVHRLDLRQGYCPGA